METDIKVRKVTQDVLKFVWFKQRIIEEKPSVELRFIPEITSKVMDNLCVSVWVGTYPSELIWEEYFNNHLERFKTSGYLFANYVGYACYLSNEGKTDAHERFIDTLSVVAHFTLQCWTEGYEEFRNVCVDLFCTYFEKELRNDFEDQGAFENFDKYLEGLDVLKKYHQLKRDNQPEDKIFQEIVSTYRGHSKPRDINGVVIKEITQDQVENHQNATSFADSITDKMRVLRNQKFENILKDFAETENQVEKLYRQNVGEATGGIASEKDLFSSQEIQKELFENDPRTSNPKRNKASSEEIQEETFEHCPGKSVLKKSEASSKEIHVEESRNDASKPRPNENQCRLKGKSPSPVETSKSDFLEESMESEDFSFGIQESYVNSGLTKIEFVKKLLRQMSEDISNISELLKFVCNEN